MSASGDLWNPSTELLNAIMDASPEAVFICDHEGKAVKINRAYEEVTGIKAQEILGKSLRELVGAGYFDTSIGLLVLESKQPTSIIQVLPRSGKEVMVTANPVLDDQGRVQMVIGVTRDLSELSRLKRELEEKHKETRRLSAELARLKAKGYDDDGVVAKSPLMEKTLSLASRVAQTRAPVLLQGASGVGKEVVAEFIHRHSPYRDGPFTTLNCAALPAELLESELFGYEAGAFTGAKKEGKPGLLELAHKGTFFLDEVGELPLVLQPKLLRVLEELKARRLGGTRTRSLDFRLISATNRDLKEMVEAGTFREDLYFRLAVVPITIPPLRERPEDIIALTNNFVATFNERYNLHKSFSPRAMQQLLLLPWEGNVRELKNFVERTMICTEGEMIEPEDFFFPETPATSTVGASGFDGRLEAAEKEMILKAYQEYGSTRKAARALGMSQSRFMRKLKKHRDQMAG